MKHSLIDNTRFQAYRTALEAKGCTLRRLWTVFVEGPISGEHYEVACFQVLGDTRPRHQTIIARSYGERDGFGSWLESPWLEVDQEVSQIVGAAT